MVILFKSHKMASVAQKCFFLVPSFFFFIFLVVIATIVLDLGSNFQSGLKGPKMAYLPFVDHLGQHKRKTLNELHRS